MGTRDIYIAIIMTLLFLFITEFLMNEQSPLCCLPAAFIDKHVAMLEGFDTGKPTQEEIDRSKKVLERAKSYDNNEVVDSNSKPVYNNDTIPNMSGY
jgi:predicted tellurium resistance membrane protein TerC